MWPSFRPLVTDMCLKNGSTISTGEISIVEQVLCARHHVGCFMGLCFLTVVQCGSQRLFSCHVPMDPWLKASIQGTIVGTTATVQERQLQQHEQKQIMFTEHLTKIRNQQEPFTWIH